MLGYEKAGLVDFVRPIRMRGGKVIGAVYGPRNDVTGDDGRLGLNA